ncbi:MAG: pyridoxamine kinase [Clostridia bacterium]|nr:pyridoxamine kinase [Clostridia bacterium]
MEQVKRVATVNDLSGFGRCSLTVALPVLGAMGFQPCPVPTAVLSAHTGYANPVVRDFTGDMAAYLDHWRTLELDFAGVYTGFLGNERQADILLPFLKEVKAQGGLCLVDPAMGDHGRLYDTCKGMVEPMKRLVGQATVATPNLTELCLLTGYHYGLVKKDGPPRYRRSIEIMARQLLGSGCESVVVTGIDQGANGQVENCVITDKEQPAVWVGSPRVERNFAGTGDVFASVLCGYLLRGEPLQVAVEHTAAFVWEATAHTARLDAPEQDGIAFEPYLHILCN